MKKLWLLLAVPIVALDQWVKWWVERDYERIMSVVWPIGGYNRLLIPGVNLTYARNTGASFSMLDGGAWRWFLVAASAIAAGLIVFAVCKKWVAHTFGIISLALVLGGAVGNFIDRARQGYVVDMFEFTFIDFAIFNVADIFVSCGGVCFCVFMLFYYRKEAEKNADLDENRI